jgi:PAS domain S-box-containing protein
MQFRKNRNTILFIIVLLFIWIIGSVIIAYNNLDKINEENLRLSTSIQQFKSILNIKYEIDSFNNDQLNKKPINYTSHQNKLNQLLKDIDNNQSINYDSVSKSYQNKARSLIDSSLILDSSLLSTPIQNNQNQKSFAPIKSIKQTINELEKNQISLMNNLDNIRIKNSKNKNFQVLFFRILFFSILVILFLFIRKYLKAFENVAKAKVEEKNAELKEIIDGFMDPFFSLDNDWNIAYMNNEAASHYSIPKKELIGKNYWDVTPHLKEHQFYDELISAKQNDKPNIVELFYRPTKQWYENRIYPNKYGISVYYREITQKKKEIERAIEEKKEQEKISERLILISNATNDALWDWNLETNEVWGNEKYYELLDKKDPNESNYEAFIRNIHPDDWDNLLEAGQISLKEKKKTLIIEYRFLNKEGNWITLLNRQKYLYDSNNNAYRTLGTLQDITFQKEIQKKLEHEIDLSEGLINSLPGLFYMFNTKGEYIRWNENLEKISGYTKDEIKNSEVVPLDFIAENQREQVGSVISKIFESRLSDYVQVDFLTKENLRIPYYFTGIFVKYNNEDCLMGVGLDISDKLKVENELRELSSRIQNIREEERTMIAREIHDELGQQLTALKMNLSWINKKISNNNPEVSIKISDSISTVDNTIQSVRKIATQLRPSILDDLGLVAALEWQTEEFQNRFNIATSFFCNQSFVEMNKDKATAIFRIYQESLTNVLRHSNATKLNSHLEVDSKQLTLKIIDNGVGFNLNDIKNKNTLGILGMKERAIMFGGIYDISSEINIGTTITVIMPIDA